jgi:hypothetical protein
MPNYFAAFATEVFTPLATIIIPGAIAVSSWLVALLWTFPSFKAVANSSHAETGLILLIVLIFVGLVLDDIGSHWELFLDHCADRNGDKQHTANWYQYLRTAFVVDPIGRRYARKLLVGLKFELGTAFACVLALPGLVWLVVLGMNRCLGMALIVICVGLTILGLIEAFHTHQTLAKTRAEILKDIRVIDRNPSST